ncbi:MAG: peptidoglycan DD-metalloendopeptidase family protein [Clostridium sp.]|uniref:peptidoglycan DD-metalloendopeptidase family protein n=1 Tax=Clostridium sp. TaxID=1506 RepID=UPI003F2DC3E9
MNKKTNGFKQKSKQMISSTKNFLKKEGFYVALFAGLCIFTVVGAMAIKNSGSEQNNEAKTPSDKEITLNVEDKTDKNVENVMENSERVENKKDQTTTKPVASDNKMNFSKPAEGKLLKGHKEPYVFKDGKQVKDGEKGDSSFGYGGISIGCPIGTSVKSAEVGIVDDVIENDVTYGVTVVIKHSNGIKTSYSNLANETKVKKGDKVTKGQEIGKTGNTSSTLKMCVKDDFLHIKVYSKDNTEVDPVKYFNYKK